MSLVIRRLIVRALLQAAIGAALSAHPAAAGPPDLEQIVRERAEAHGVSGAWLVAVAECESGFNPYAVGALGELGILQLRPGGELSRFYRYGYTEVWSVWQQADFTARRFAEGGSRAWSCA